MKVGVESTAIERHACPTCGHACPVPKGPTVLERLERLLRIEGSLDNPVPVERIAEYFNTNNAVAVVYLSRLRKQGRRILRVGSEGYILLTKEPDSRINTNAEMRQ